MNALAITLDDGTTYSVDGDGWTGPKGEILTRLNRDYLPSQWSSGSSTYETPYGINAARAASMALKADVIVPPSKPLIEGAVY